MKKTLVLVVACTLLFVLLCPFVASAFDAGGGYTIPDPSPGSAKYNSLVFFDSSTGIFWRVYGEVSYNSERRLKTFTSIQQFRPGQDEAWVVYKSGSVTYPAYFNVEESMRLVYCARNLSNFQGELIYEEGTYPLPAPPPPPYQLTPEVVETVEGILPGLGATSSVVLEVSLVILAILLGVSLIRPLLSSLL